MRNGGLDNYTLRNHSEGKRETANKLSKQLVEIDDRIIGIDGEKKTLLRAMNLWRAMMVHV